MKYPDSSGVLRGLVRLPVLALVLVRLNLLWLALVAVAMAQNARLELTRDGGKPRLRILGSPDAEWWIESSTNLATWVRPDSVPPLASNAASDAPVRPLEIAGSQNLYRAIRTDGLYDTSFLRSFHFRFAQPDWQQLLTAAHGTESNVVCRLELDNGTALEGVGARYKGYSSFSADIPKKSLNVQVDHIHPASEVLGYETFNLNNAWGDKTLLREAVFFNVMHRYAPSPRATLARVFINDAYWGLYSLAQQEDSDLIREWFPSANGDRWRTPNKSAGASSLNWLGTNVTEYFTHYDLRKSADTNRAWARLVHAIDVLNNTPESTRRDALENVFAVDSWLWFLAIGNIFADEDSYMFKGADYSFYFEPESGRIHPLEHDGNEASIQGFHEVSPVEGADADQRPMLSRLLVIPELRQRYLAHLRTVLSEAFHPDIITPVIERWSLLSTEALSSDRNKGFPMSEYPAELDALKQFVTNRHRYLTLHAELIPQPPTIFTVRQLEPPTPGQNSVIRADVRAASGEAIRSVSLWSRVGTTGKYNRTPMFDDGAHLDRAAGDGIYAAQSPPLPAGAMLHFYVEARSDNKAGATAFFPSAAEAGPLTHRAPLLGSVVVINEFMADNEAGVRDPQGQREDWIELRNLSDAVVDLSGYYLSDDPAALRKWRFPPGTQIPARGYLLIWADGDILDQPGLHADFKLSAAGETLLLVDTDERFNAVLDTLTYGPMAADEALGRSTTHPLTFQTIPPTPGRANP